ncbi:GNAT family N-acetyltransferase [Rhizobium rhizogenes]|uniref:GNAT family N-acetyltransferase n=1 Tax=Rhizobium rhizogenes TaxID=359 RepID=UPI0015726B53|nr:N-acetyltransferase [Rhizobium rhizogenes]NTF42578.1 N-acetyltransferase [Rhizobium rhizogenes]
MTVINSERPEHIGAIRAITTAAFAGAEYSSGTEAMIIHALRTAGALTLSLVAIEDGEIIGHVAFSPVSIESGATEWFGLGPVSVLPDRQGSGIGKALIEAGLAKLKEDGAHGCVVLGDPHYYARFGFRNDPALRYADVPAEYFQHITFKGPTPGGEVRYHQAFEVS